MLDWGGVLIYYTVLLYVQWITWFLLHWISFLVFGVLELGLALKPLKSILNLGLYFLLLAIHRTVFVQVAKAFSANFFFAFNNHFFQIDFFRRYLKSSQSGQWPTCATFWRQWSDSRRCMWHRPFSYICIVFIIWGRRRASFFTSMWMFLFGLLFVPPDRPLPATSLPISQQYVWCTRAQGFYIVLPTLTPCKRLNFSTMSPFIIASFLGVWVSVVRVPEWLIWS